MREAGLACKTKHKFKATTNSKHNQPIAPNHLDRQFTVKRPNQAYVGDITYIHTQEGWLYLAVVIDLFSRQVVGWSMADHMRTQLVNDALLMALWKRKPDKGLVWHTDRGSQYASESHRALLMQHGIQQSMSRKGNCWDNAVSESFFHTLKTELVHHQTYQTRAEAKPASCIKRPIRRRLTVRSWRPSAILRRRVPEVARLFANKVWIIAVNAASSFSRWVGVR